MPQSFTCLNYHIVFSTKNRLPQISSEWRPRLHEYIGGILRAQDSILLAAGGTSDHLHLLAVLGKMTGIAEVLRVIKANSPPLLVRSGGHVASRPIPAEIVAFSEFQPTLPTRKPSSDDPVS